MHSKLLPRWVSRVLNAAEGSYVKSLHAAVVLSLPLLLVGAAALLIKNMPVNAFHVYMAQVFGQNWMAPCDLVYNTSFNILALAISFTLSSSLVDAYNEKYPVDPVNKILVVLMSFASLLIMLGQWELTNTTVLAWTGMRGFFGSIVITTISVQIFLYLYKMRRLRFAFHAEEYDPLLPQVFAAILPMFGTILFFIGLRFTLFWMNIPTLHQALDSLVSFPFVEAQDNFLFGSVYSLLTQVYWFFGIHGAELLEPLVRTLFATSMEANSLAYNSGLAPQYLYTKYLFDSFVWIGGAGCTLGLLLALFVRSYDKGSRRIAFIALGPSLFNINEILLFGLPVVFNPIYLLPFIFVPFVLLCFSALVMNLGLVPFPLFENTWTTPPLVNAYIATGSWRGVALQVVNLAIATALYLPFVAISDRKKQKGRQVAFSKLVRGFFHNTQNQTTVEQAFSGMAPSLIVSLGEQLRIAIQKNSPHIFLRYQPRINLVQKKVPTVEALLRWEHPTYGIIPPQLVLALAEYVGIGDKLDEFIVQKGLKQLTTWREKGLDVSLALHVTESQLQDKLFVPQLLDLLRKNGLPPSALVLEVSETLALNPSAYYGPVLSTLHENGIRISLDDFGSSFQSLSHLKRLPITDLHLHKALVENVVLNKSYQDILVAIQGLCQELDIVPTVEYVESQEQLDALLELNFTTFQGFWFKEPVQAHICEEFIESFERKMHMRA